MILTFRPGTLADAEWIGQHLREEDKREVETASGLPATTVVPMSFTMSRECYTFRLATPRGTVEDNPCAIFGVSDDPKRPDMGIVWLLGTPEIRRSALSFMREAPKWIDHFLTRYPEGIHNVVDTRNDLHIRWLLLTGFIVGDEPLMVNGVPFVHAVRFK